MSSGVIGALARANKTVEPEHSITLRVVVFAAVAAGALSVGAVQAISPGMTALIVAALALAYWVSYVRRESDNWHIKIVLAMAALFAVTRFLGQLGGIATLDEVRFPLADLFLWVQVIHGFDLPQRRDLNFSLGSSLTLMAVAGSLSQDMTYAIFLFAYALLALTALVLGHRSRLSSGTTTILRPRGPKTTRVPWRTEARRGVVTTLLAAGMLFLVIPQPQAQRTFALPFSLGSGLGIFGGGRAVNPGFSEGSAESRSGTGVSFHGFGESMDLNVRGTPSDDIVMRVRASQAAMWRSGIFDNYDGRIWTGPEADPEPLPDSLPAHYPVEFRDLGPRTSVSQTFYVEAELPNAIFAAAQPGSIWFEGGLSVDSLGVLRTDVTLTPGSVYSVVSSRGTATAEELRDAGEELPPAHLLRYLQLPAGLPERVGELAERVTAGATNRYDRVRAIERYLSENYRYNLESPIAPQGQDAVDHFLFETDVGYCEQFASATVVMLRRLGIPARVVVGYTPGYRNPFTWLHEVKASDAHAWIEVWFPRYGWYEFDPTFAIPAAQAELADVLPIARVLSFAFERIRTWLPAGGAEIVRSALLVTVAGLAGIFLLLLFRRRDRSSPSAGAGTRDRGPLGRAFVALEGALATAGAPRPPNETAREAIRRAARLVGGTEDGTSEVVDTHLYGRAPVAPDRAERAVSHLEGIAASLRERAAEAPR